MKNKLIYICLLLVTCLTLLIGFLFGRATTPQPQEETTTQEEESKEEKKDNINVVLFGLSDDNRGLDTNRCDSIIVITISQEAKEIRMTSILRDTKAEIEGYEPQKINASYKYGGADLAIKTINQNFGVFLNEYITVDFEGFASVVDKLGGVDIELTKAEMNVLGIYGDAGIYHLDGNQAVAFARIRKIDSDVSRAARQRELLQLLLEKFIAVPVSDKVSITASMFKMVKTNIPLGKVLDLAKIKYAEMQVVTNYIPDDTIDVDVRSTIDEHGEWVWIYDTKVAGERLYDIMYK